MCLFLMIFIFYTTFFFRFLLVPLPKQNPSKKPAGSPLATANPRMSTLIFKKRLLHNSNQVTLCNYTRELQGVWQLTKRDALKRN
jgi:hypothetical protein